MKLPDLKMYLFFLITEKPELHPIWIEIEEKKSQKCILPLFLRLKWQDFKTINPV